MLLNRLAYKLIHWLPKHLQLRALTQLGLFNGAVDPEMKSLMTFLPKQRRRLALDVGANNGVTSMVLSRVFHTVYAFEPNPELLDRWKNVVPTNVSCSQLAVSDSQGETKLRIPIHNGQKLTGWASLDQPQVGSSFEMLTVGRTTLDDFLDCELYSQIDFIKIDVEGHELAVLHGAKQILQASRPVILAETNFENATLRNYLVGFGYRAIDRSNAAELGLSDFSEQNTLFVS